MRVIVINPWNQTVTEAEHNGNYRDYYRLLSGETCDGGAPAKVDTFALAEIGDPDRHIMFVDDEGLFRNPQAYFMLGGQSAVFAGRGVIARSDGSEQEAGATLTLEQVRASVTWLPVGIVIDPGRPVVEAFDSFEDLIAKLETANNERTPLIDTRHLQ